MTTPTANRDVEKLWSADLARFADRLRLQHPPRLIIKTGRFSPLIPFLPWSTKPGAWAGLNRIVISTQLLDSPKEMREYLLAHELGHIANEDSRTVLTLTAAMQVTVILTYFYKHAPFYFRLSNLAALLIFTALLARMFLRYRNEIAADAVAASLIGKPAVEQGIHDMAKVEGSMTEKRRARLKGLNR